MYTGLKSKFAIKYSSIFLLLSVCVFHLEAQDSLKYIDEIEASSSNNTTEDLGKNLIGFQMHYLENASPVNKVNDSAIGIGFQFEPDFLYISDTLKMGYIMEYSHSTGLADYKFFNNFLYLQYNLKSEESSLLNFYWNLGTGLAYVDYKKDNAKIYGLNFAFLSEIGWQGLSFDDLVVRFSYRGTLITERRATYGNDGAQISVLFRF